MTFLGERVLAGEIRVLKGDHPGGLKSMTDVLLGRQGERRRGEPGDKEAQVAGMCPPVQPMPASSLPPGAGGAQPRQHFCPPLETQGQAVALL